MTFSDFSSSVKAGVPNTRQQFAVATKFRAVAPGICGPSVWNSIHGTLLAPRILRWLLDFGGNLCTLDS